MPTDCVKLLEKLISHSTVNPGGDEHGLATLLGAELARLNADSVEVVSLTPEERGEDQPGAYVWATFGEPTVLINVHLDTVPVTSGWTRDPFALTEEGDHLYGLGTADTKGAIACVLTAIERVSARGFGVLFSGDEERGSRCMSAFLDSDRAKGIERAIVCEPTARALGVVHRGIRAYTFATRGPGGHSSRADATAKPNITMARLALELNDLGNRYLEASANDPADAQAMQGLCLNVAELHGGVAFNVIPESSTLSMSVRPGPGFDASRFDAELGTCIRAAAGGETIEMACGLARDAFETRDVAAFKSLVGDFPTKHVVLDFWTEAAMLSAAGIDAVVIGPGDIAAAHAPDEFVTVGDLTWATSMFEALLSGLAT